MSQRTATRLAWGSFPVSLLLYGSGLQNMADRMEAVGGTFTVAAAVGAGTTVTGRMPAAALEFA